MFNSQTSQLTTSTDINNGPNLAVNLVGSSGQNDAFSQQVAKSLLPDSNNERILTTQHKAPIAPPQESKIRLRNAERAPQDGARHFQPRQVELLKAPFLSADYKHSALSWSARNQLAVALGEQLYIFDIQTRCPTELVTPLKGEEVPEPITAVQFSLDGSHIAVGRLTRVEIYNCQMQKCIRRIQAHQQAITDIAWYNGTTLLLTSCDGTITLHDLKQKQSLLNSLKGHTDAVLSCKWSLEETPLYLATGSADNTVCIWDARQLADARAPILRYTDAQASTKALAWCPFTTTSVLAVGGGARDGHIRLYDVSNDVTALQSGQARSFKPFETIDTQSQITSINFAMDDKELVTTHGFKVPNAIGCTTHNSICTWRYPSLVRTSCTDTFNDRLLFGITSPFGAEVAFGQAANGQGFGHQGSVFVYQLWETAQEKQKRVALNNQTKGGGGTSTSKLSTRIR